MNIEELTIAQVRQLASMLNLTQPQIGASREGLSQMIGSKCIIRTFSAGVWFGEIRHKDKNEVIVANARRLWYWKAASGISLSSVAIHGLSDESKVVEAVDNVWLEAIELIPCTQDAIRSIEGKKNVKAS